MAKPGRYLLFFLFLFCSLFSHSQQKEIDSLRKVFAHAQKDTSRVSLLKQIGIQFRNVNLDSSETYFTQALKITEAKKLKIQQLDIQNEQAFNRFRKNEIDECLEQLHQIHRSLMKLKGEYPSKKDQKKISKIFIANYNYQGSAYRKQSELEVAIQQFELGLEIAETLNDYDGKSSLLNNLAQTYYMQGKYPQSLSYCLRGIELNEEKGNKQGVASSTGNAGILFKEMGEYEKAISYFKKALALNKELNNQRSIAVNLGNIGVGYGHLNQPEKSIEYYQQAIDIHKELNETSGLQYNYGNIGIEYTKLKKYDKALEYFNKSLEILKDDPDDYVATFIYNSVASTYLQMKDYTQAKFYLDQAQVLAEGMNSMNQMKDNYEAQAELYEALHQPEKALDFYKKFVKYRDSIRSEETIRNSLAMEYEHMVESDSIINAQKDLVRDADIEKKNLLLEKNAGDLRAQQNYFYFSLGGIVLVLLFALFMYKRYQISQKQNAIIQAQKQQAEIQKKDIEFQKSLVDTKQKEIIDSINYAERIQQAIMARPEEIKKYLPESFLFYQPKDIVAGDFYFFEVTDTHIFLAAADCTGHGVPGALISVVCSNALTRCVKEFKLVDPGEILNKTRELVLETLLKSGSDIKEGMDISIAVFENLKNKQQHESSNIKSSNFQISWAGANNPLWYSEGDEIRHITANKQAIGQNYEPKPYTSHKVDLKPGSWLFLFTDGYADQFGGPDGKKYKYSQLQELFRTNRNENPEVLKAKLIESFNSWKGDFWQVDDICIIGVRV